MVALFMFIGMIWMVCCIIGLFLQPLIPNGKPMPHYRRNRLTGWENFW